MERRSIAEKEESLGDAGVGRVVVAPEGPAHVAFLSSSTRAAQGPPGAVTGAEALAAELLSQFFDTIDAEAEEPTAEAGPGAAEGVAECTRQLEVAIAKVRRVLQEPLEYIVLHAPFVHIRASPVAGAASLGRLEPGTVVHGYPAGSWLYLEVDEHRAQAAWALVEGPAPEKRSLLAPTWAALATTEGRPELHWQGLPSSVAVQYQLEWRQQKSTGASDTAVGQRFVGTKPRTLFPALSADSALKVRVVAQIIDGGLQHLGVAGAWTDMQTLRREAQAQRRSASPGAADRPGGAEGRRRHLEEQQRREAEGLRQRPAAETELAIPSNGSKYTIKRQGHWDPIFSGGSGKPAVIVGSVSVTERYEQLETMDLSNATMWTIYANPVNQCMPGPELPEDSRFRAFVTSENPCVMLLELNAVASFNMMDPDLSNDAVFGMDAIYQLLQQPRKFKQAPLSYTIQGSGPHFCPGGNPNPKFTPGHTLATTTQYTGYLPFIRCRELHAAGVVALHGSMVGGGVAYSLNCTMRIGTTTLSVAYGNASRGAVPGMQLSTNVCQTLGLSGAIDFYLCDSTYSSYAAVRGGFLSKVVGGIPPTKAKGLTIARSFAQAPHMTRVPQVKPPVDLHRFADEAWGINLSAKTGVMFASLKQAKRKSEPKKEPPPEEQPVEEYRPRRRGAKRRPRRQ